MQISKDWMVILITLAILPWVGGKQALFKTIIKRFPADYRRRTFPMLATKVSPTTYNTEKP